MKILSKTLARNSYTIVQVLKNCFKSRIAFVLSVRSPRYVFNRFRETCANFVYGVYVTLNIRTSGNVDIIPFTDKPWFHLSIYINSSGVFRELSALISVRQTVTTVV